MKSVRTLAHAALVIALIAAAAVAQAATLGRHTAIDLGQGTEAMGLNASGQVTGNVIVDGMHRAFITGAQGSGISLLATLGGPTSRATAINDSGQVVGFSWLSDDLRHGGYHAFVTGAGGQGITDLGTLGGISGVCGVCSQATGINNAGVVVGRSADTGHNARIFVADPGHYTALRSIGSGSDWTYAGPINNQGLIAGSVNQGGDYRAILVHADGSGMVPLADATDLRQPSVTGINDQGWIVANSDLGRAWLLVPVPEPASWALWLAGLAVPAPRRLHRR